MQREAHVWGQQTPAQTRHCPPAVAGAPSHGQTRGNGVPDRLPPASLPRSLAELSVPLTPLEHTHPLPPRPGTRRCPEPLQPALPAPGDPPGAGRARGKLVWPQPGACGLGSGRDGLLCPFPGTVPHGCSAGNGRRAGVTSSLRAPRSLGGSDRAAATRAAGAGGTALRPGTLRGSRVPGAQRHRRPRTDPRARRCPKRRALPWLKSKPGRRQPARPGPPALMFLLPQRDGPVPRLKKAIGLARAQGHPPYSERPPGRPSTPPGPRAQPRGAAGVHRAPSLPTVRRGEGPPRGNDGGCPVPLGLAALPRVPCRDSLASASPRP